MASRFGLISSKFDLDLTELVFVLFGLEFHESGLASCHRKVFLILALVFRQCLDDVLKVCLSTDIYFDMSEISFVKEFDHSVSNVSLISLDLPHVSNDDGLEILADGSEIRVSHYLLHQILKLIETHKSIRHGNFKFSTCFSSYDSLFIRRILFACQQRKYSGKFLISFFIDGVEV